MKLHFHQNKLLFYFICHVTKFGLYSMLLPLYVNLGKQVPVQNCKPPLNGVNARFELSWQDPLIIVTKELLRFI